MQESKWIHAALDPQNFWPCVLKVDSTIFICRSGVGLSGSRQTYFYAEVTDDMKVSEGGGLVEEGEMIEVYELPLVSAHTLMWDETKPKPVGFILAFMWFFQNKRPAGVISAQPAK